MLRLALGCCLVAACGASHRATADLGAIAIVPTEYDAVKMTQAVLGPQLELVRPPQGGWVVLVGARATGFDAPTTVQLTGNLKDASGTVLATDARTVTLMQAPDDASVWIPDLRSLSTVSNITVCPSTSTTDRVNATFTVEVQIVDGATQRMGSASRDAQLVCRQSDATLQANCMCECQGNFVLGKCP